MTNDLIFICFALCLMAGDVLSGIIKAIITKSFSSEKMRIGFWHKMSILILLALGFGFSFATNFIEAPIFLSGISYAVTLYVCIMEISSILENLSESNPDLDLEKLKEIFYHENK